MADVGQSRRAGSGKRGCFAAARPYLGWGATAPHEDPMLLKFQTPNGPDVSTWINPEQVAGVHTQTPDVTTIYLVGGFEQRVSGRPEDVAGRIDEAQRSLRPQTA